MEIALVYREIQQLLIKDESVALPKVGEFAIVAKSATFLEDCRTILPPKKELLFSPSSEQGENDVFQPWQQELAEEISRQLQLNSAFEVPGFGIFRQTEGGELSFEVSPEFDFAPDSFSLEAISLELNPEPAQAPETEPAFEEPAEEFMEESAEEPAEEGPAVPQPASDEPKPQPQQITQPESQFEPASAAKKQKVLMWILVAAIVLLLIILFVSLFKEQFAQMVRTLLYTEEELQIIEQWRQGYNL